MMYDYNRGGPIGHWKFDECSGTVANDESGFGNNGTISIGATGSNTSAGTCGSGISTQAWNAGSSGKYGASLGFDGTDDYVNAGTLTATGFSTPTIYINGKTGSNITSNQWQHVVVTSATAETASNLTFGRTQDTNYLEGQIDDVRIYNYALSPT